MQFVVNFIELPLHPSLQLTTKLCDVYKDLVTHDEFSTEYAREMMDEQMSRGTNLLFVVD